MKKKQQKKRLKKYKGKYVTADRLDMSKGGRVGYQKGKRVRDLNDPTGQTFLDPKDVPNMKVGNQEPRNNTPAPPVENRAAPTTFQQAPIESKRPDVIQPQVTPKQPITPPQQERFIENIDNAANNIDTTFRQAPTSTGKGSDQMFIGREGDIRPQANFDVQDKFRGRGRDERDEKDKRDTGPQIGDTKKGSGLFGKFITYVWDGNNWVVQQKEDKEPVTEDEFTGMTDAQKQAVFESERGERVIETGRTAEQLAAGEIPEGMIPTADVQKIMERRPDETQEQYETRIAAMEADTVQLDPTNRS